MIRGIAGELREALLNLVQNALDAMAGGGTLGMRTVRERRPRCALEVRGLRHRHVGRGARARVRAVLHDEGRERHRTRPRRGVRNREAPSRPRRDRVDARVGDDDSAGLSAGAHARLEIAEHRDAHACASRGECCSSRITRTAASSCRRCWKSDGHSGGRRSDVAEATRAAGDSDSAYEVLVTDIGLPDGSGWDLDLLRARAVAVAANRCRHRMGTAVGQDTDGDFILRKPVRTSELLAQVAGEG